MVRSRECATTRPLGQKKCGIGTPPKPLKKQQTLEQVLYRVPEHCIRAVKTATSYTDRTKLLHTFALMSTNPLDPSRKRRRRVHARRRNYRVPSCSRKLRHASTSQRIQRDVLIPAFIRGSCNVNKGVTNGTNGILDTSTAWNKIF